MYGSRRSLNVCVRYAAVAFCTCEQDIVNSIIVGSLTCIVLETRLCIGIECEITCSIKNKRTMKVFCMTYLLNIKSLVNLGCNFEKRIKWWRSGYSLKIFPFTSPSLLARRVWLQHMLELMAFGFSDVKHCKTHFLAESEILEIVAVRLSRLGISYVPHTSKVSLIFLQKTNISIQVSNDLKLCSQFLFWNHLVVILDSEYLLGEVWMSIDQLDWFETMLLTLISDLRKRTFLHVLSLSDRI